MPLALVAKEERSKKVVETGIRIRVRMSRNRGPETCKKAKLRGETSEGMICSEAELHLSDDQGWRIEIPGRPRLTTYGALGDEAIGTLTLGMMTRVALGHTGRPLRVSSAGHFAKCPKITKAEPPSLPWAHGQSQSRRTQ